MRTYNVPRDVKGEGRILYVFSTKALIYTFVGVVIGFFFYLILSVFDMDFVAYIIIAILGLIGFCIGTFKVPESNAFSLTKNAGGEKIDDVILRMIRFKMKKNRIYVYSLAKKENTEDKEGGNK